MRFALGLRRVCVGLPFHVLPVYRLTTVCLIIRYRNSGNLRVRVQGTYFARCCQRFSTITRTSDALFCHSYSRESFVAQQFHARACVALSCSKFHRPFSFHLLLCVFCPFTVRLASVLRPLSVCSPSVLRPFTVHRKRNANSTETFL